MPAKNQDNVKPEVNIGLVGHVDHGKTTLLQRFSGKWADTHSEEQKRGITIKLGYADVSVFKCKENYTAMPGKDCEFVRKISFIDAPGHETLMATMISGAAIMDGALLLVAANEECPQPQTKEHLMALELMGIKNIVIVQNKIDLISKEQVKMNHNQIKKFTKGTIAENAPIVPISAQHDVNIGYLLEAMEEAIPTPKRDTTKKPMFLVARSFDINKPGTKVDKIIGGVFGGTVKQGLFKLGDKVEITPGREVNEKGRTKWVPIKTTIKKIHAGGMHLEEIGPGGSLGILTTLDPATVKSDQLSGSIISKEGESPKVYVDLDIKPKLLERVVGGEDVAPIKDGEPLMINVNSQTTAGIVMSLKKGKANLKLKRPIVGNAGDVLALSRRVGSRWRLIGTAELGK